MISPILAPLAPRNFKVSPNNVSQQLSLSWEISSITNRPILLYQYCYIKLNDSNQMCGNTTDNSTKSVNITTLGWWLFLLLVMNARIIEKPNLLSLFSTIFSLL